MANMKYKFALIMFEIVCYKFAIVFVELSNEIHNFRELINKGHNAKHPCDLIKIPYVKKFNIRSLPVTPAESMC